MPKAITHAKTLPSLHNQETQLQEQALSQRLLAWFDDHGRTLPWRARPTDPYRVWVSEIMLQQTTVATVIPYYNAFLERWPTLASFAHAQTDEVLHAWQGLGYYRRALNMIACRDVLMREHHGDFPRMASLLKHLPGIGDYTSAAIASIAFGEPVAAVDGNVMRVMSRMFSLEAPKPKLFKPVLACTQPLIPSQRAGDFTQALMDLGSQICTPTKPQCPLCPWKEACCAYQQQRMEAFPVAAPRSQRPTRHGYAYCLLDPTGQNIRLEQRPSSGLLASTWQVPMSEWAESPPSLAAVEAGEVLGTVEHTFSHFHLKLTVIKVSDEIKNTLLFQPSETSSSPQRWCSREQIKHLALSSLMKKVLARCPLPPSTLQSVPPA